jgi:hypothetical protein
MGTAGSDCFICGHMVDSLADGGQRASHACSRSRRVARRNNQDMPGWAHPTPAATGMWSTKGTRLFLSYAKDLAQRDSATTPSIETRPGRRWTFTNPEGPF